MTAFKMARIWCDGPPAFQSEPDTPCPHENSFTSTGTLTAVRAAAQAQGWTAGGRVNTKGDSGRFDHCPKCSKETS